MRLNGDDIPEAWIAAREGEIYHTDADCHKCPDSARPLREDDLRRAITECRFCQSAQMSAALLDDD